MCLLLQNVNIKFNTNKIQQLKNKWKIKLFRKNCIEKVDRNYIENIMNIKIIINQKAKKLCI